MTPWEFYRSGKIPTVNHFPHQRPSYNRSSTNDKLRGRFDRLVPGWTVLLFGTRASAQDWSVVANDSILITKPDRLYQTPGAPPQRELLITKSHSNEAVAGCNPGVGKRLA